MNHAETKNLLFARFFGVSSMLKKSEPLGELPSTKQACQNFLKMARPSALESLLVGLTDLHEYFKPFLLLRRRA